MRQHGSSVEQGSPVSATGLKEVYRLIMRQMLIARLLVCFCLMACCLAGEEGMWTFDNLPLATLEKKYGFVPSAQWLEHVRLSCVRFSDGGSGSFISPEGLLLTNHHVALGQLQKSSSAQHDYVRDGFYARTPEEELKSPDLYIDVLMSLENVTAEIKKRIAGAANDQEQAKARRGAIAEIEKESKSKTGLEAEVVTLYSGGEYWLYRYKRYTDVRIVFAPEQQAAFFGGDPDNFTYPRYDLDLAMFRAYENGQPVDSSHYLKWNAAGAKDEELVFVSGNPAGTQRNATLSTYQLLTRTIYPSLLEKWQRLLAMSETYAKRGPEQAREAQSQIFGMQNSIKAVSGIVKAGSDADLTARKRQEEQDFRSKIDANPEWKKAFGAAWTSVEQADQRYAPRAKFRVAYALDSNLDRIARNIVEYVAEVKKPAGERLPGFQEAELQTLRYQLFSPAPVYPEFEKARLAASLKFALDKLGPGDPFVRIALDGKTPEQVATEVISGTKLADPGFRKQLVEGGSPAVDASADPLIVFERKLDPIRREEITWYRNNVQAITQRAGEQLGEARFAVYGKAIYPDGTFTLRLSYGQVKGYPMNGTVAPPITTFYGLYDRANSFGKKPPFNLVERFEAGRTKLNLATPFDFVSSNDVIGGNSGSPVINRDGELVGLVFDGNIESLAGDLIYDGRTNRTVSVHTAAITEALRKLYNVAPLLKEIGISE
jgi:hypothetical protein